MPKGFSNLNIKPEFWDYIIQDQVTHAQILRSDAVVDFWGRIVHKDWIVRPSPIEFKDAFFPEPSPSFGMVPGNNTALPGQYFVQLNPQNVITSLFYSTDYAPGQYTTATPAQIANYVPILNNQVFTYNFSSASSEPIIGTLAVTDPSGFGIFWNIVNDPTGSLDALSGLYVNGAFSINQATGQLYVAQPNLITTISNSFYNYSIIVNAASFFPGNPNANATVTVQATAVPSPVITSVSSFTLYQGNEIVETAAATDPSGFTVSWSINGGANSSLFNIGNSNGVLSFNSIANTVSNYAVQIAASNPFSLANQLVSVDVLSAAPQITSSNIFNINTSSTTVGTCIATDPQSVSFLWSISGGANAGLFTIGASNGVLSFNSLPTAANYAVQVKADNTNGYFSTQDITVDVAQIFTPSVLPGLRLWLDASNSSSLTLTANSVSSWKDSSSNAAAFVQSTSSLQPVFSNTALNGSKPGILFGKASTGNNTNLICVNTPSYWNFLSNSATSSTVFIISSLSPGTNTTANLATILSTTVPSGGSGNGINFIVTNNGAGNLEETIQIFSNITGASSGTGTLSGSQSLNSAYSGTGSIVNFIVGNSSNTVTFYVADTIANTVTGTGGFLSNSTPGMSLQLGAAALGNALPAFRSTTFSGTISEILIYNNILNAANVTNVYNYLQTKWGVN